MNVLFLGYWNIDDPLTKATIFPHLKILQELDIVERIVFVNTERISSNPVFNPGFNATKIIYCPLFSKNFAFSLTNKIVDYIYFPKQLNRLVIKNSINIVIARGATAGSLAYLLWRRSRVPFLVESFEPHADYMLESGVWSRFDLRFRFQKIWEQKQKKYAKGLMPVSDNYKRYLLHEGISADKIVTVPCSVDFNVFSFNPIRRSILRAQYNLKTEDIVGIYAGKFGGLYLQDESFTLYAGAFSYFPNFFLIILTSTEFHGWVHLQIKRYNLPVDRIMVKFVKNEEVPDYMLISDFGYATYKPGFFKAFLSPVKLGEYWACGLFVILTKGIGDESDFLERENAGVLFDPKDMNRVKIDEMYSRLDDLLRRVNLRTEIPQLAISFRHSQKAIEAYKYFLLN